MLAVILLTLCGHASTGHSGSEMLELLPKGPRASPRELHLKGLALLHGSAERLPDPEAAAIQFRRMIQLRPGSSAAYHNLGVSLQGAAQHLVGTTRRAVLVEAADTYKASLVRSSTPMFHSYYNLAMLLNDEFAEGVSQQASHFARIAQRLSPDVPESNQAMGMIELLKQNYGEAHRWFTRSFQMRRGDPLGSNISRLPMQQNGGYDDLGKQSRRNSNKLGSWGKAEDGGQLVALHKLVHDTEQLEYQLLHQLLPTRLHATIQHEITVMRSAIGNLHQTLQPILHQTHDGNLTQVNVQGLASMQSGQANTLASLVSYRHLVHVQPPTTTLPKSALNIKSSKERVSLQQTYNSGVSSSVIAVDNLLTPQAREKLYKFALESNIFHQQKVTGYLGSQLEDGFTSPLLFQIAQELQSMLPTVFKGHKLQHAWAYKYDSTLREGIQAHADQAAVNCNIWITPEDSNVGGKDTGGLVIFKAAAPANWSHFDYNNRGSETRIEALLDSDSRRNTTVPYRSNRAVIFHSSLFHQTDKFKFRKGYKSRRINITLLFGKKPDGIKNVAGQYIYKAH